MVTEVRDQCGNVIQPGDPDYIEAYLAAAEWEWKSKTKLAYMWVLPYHPNTVGYPGVHADLFFSSKEKFFELLGRPLDEFEALVQTWVPLDFDNWDYIPENY